MLTKEALVRYYSIQQGNRNPTSFWIEPERFMAEYPGSLMPVVNGVQKTQYQIRTVSDIDNVKRLYVREAHKEFKSDFGTSTKQFMEDRKYSQSMFDDLKSTTSYLSKVDDSWKITKSSFRDSLFDARKRNAGKSRMSAEEVEGLVKELEGVFSSMQEYLDVMSNINEGWAYSASGEIIGNQPGIPIKIDGAARTSMEKAKFFEKELLKELNSANKKMSKIKRYSKGESPYLAELKSIRTGDKNETVKLAAHSGNKKRDVLSVFEGYVSSVKGIIFEGVVSKILAEHIIATQADLGNIMSGTGTGETVAGHTKKTATADIQYPDPLNLKAKIGVSVKNQPGLSGTGTTSILTTGLEVGSKIAASHDGATQEALILMYAQSKNSPGGKTSTLNQMMSASLIDYAIAGAGKDRIHLMAFREGVIPYPDFLEKAIESFGVSTKVRDNKDAALANDYIRRILNGEPRKGFEKGFVPSLSFTYTRKSTN